MCRFPRGRLVRRRFRIPAALLPLLLVAAISAAFFVRLSQRVRPLIETIAVSKTVSLISLAISEETDGSLMAEAVAYSDFISVETDPAGKVTLLSFRTAECSRFKRLVTQRLVERLESIEPELLSVPMGNLTGITLLSALGPSVRVRVQSVGDVKTEFENSFVSAGVNQTKHSVYMRTEVTVYLLIPGEIIPVSVEERVCVAETVIVGEVPDTYLNLMDGAN